MKIALLADVHANLPALEAVLTHAEDQGVDAIWNTGDFIGYGAFPDSVVQRLWHENALSIVGNYDLKVLKFKNKRHKWRKSKHPLKFYAFGLDRFDKIHKCIGSHYAYLLINIFAKIHPS